MSAPLSRLADKFSQLPSEPLLEIDGGVEQSGRDGDLNGPLGIQRRAPVDPFLVGREIGDAIFQAIYGCDGPMSRKRER